MADFEGDTPEVSVPDAERVDSGIDSYVVYHVRVRCGEIAWAVKRRFKQFDRLHDYLLAEYAKEKLPALPPKTVRRQHVC